MKTRSTRAGHSFTVVTRSPRSLLTLFLVASFSCWPLLNRAQAAAGNLDPTFGSGGKVTTDFFGSRNAANALAIQADGKVVAAGEAVIDFSSSKFALARYDGFGSNFDICLRDDVNENLFQFNSTNGNYLFSNCRKGFTLSGRGIVRIRSCKIELQASEPDRSISVVVNSCAHTGSATVRALSPGITYSIADSDITNNTCACR